MRKKIIFLEAVQNYGGARISTLELAKRLRDNGDDVEMIDFYGSCAPFLEAANGFSIPVTVLDKRDEPYIISKSSNRFVNILHKFKFIPHWLKLRNKIIEYSNQYDADIFMVNNYKTLLICSFIRNRKFKIIFFARGWFLPKQIGLIKSLLLKSNVDKFICVSEATRHALFCGKIAELDKIIVVHNGINEERLPTEVEVINKKPNDIIILHSGGFLPEKGQRTSLEIAKRLKNEGIPFKLLLVGLVYKGYKSQRFYSEIKNEIIKDGLVDNVIIIENRTNIIPIFRAVDILIHPSATEGLPRVVMEAMILKKPVIANAVGGVTDYILSGYTGYLADYNNVEDYVTYIKKLIFNKDNYTFIQENAYELIKTCFTEDDQVQSLNKIFRV